jgi:methyltransferase (TIGR00027 family)
LKQGRFSRTAYKVALRRAAHQLFDQPKILDDPLAVPIIGEEAAAQLSASARERNHAVARAFRAFMVARSRYAEDQLAQAVERGVSQYVVLGAGLDTSAYRSPHGGLQIFEVDHPATQAWKLERLQAAGIAIPASLKFAPVDFEQQTLASGLEQAGFEFGSPAFFSWLGVTPYLSRESCMTTLRFIGHLPLGSGVAFDFAVDPKLLNLRQRFGLYVLSRRVAAAGEPFQLLFRAAELAEELRSMGFQRAETLNTKEINARYFKDRADELRVRGGLGQLMGAWV